MKEYDKIEVISDNEKYKKQSVFKRMKGFIASNQKIYNCWLVVSPWNDFQKKVITCFNDIKIILKEEAFKVVFID